MMGVCELREGRLGTLGRVASRPGVSRVRAPFNTRAVRAGDALAKRTLRDMRAMVRADIRSQDFQLFARDAVRRHGADLRDPRSIALTVREYVRAKLSFVRDPDKLESVMAPLKMMQALREYGTIAGDCDDAAVLSASMGSALGLRSSLVMESYDWQRGLSPYQHVYTVLRSPDGKRKWSVVSDTTRSSQALPPKVQRRVTLTV